MTDTIESASDQTFFSNVEPLFEDGGVPVSGEFQSGETAPVDPEQQKRKKLLILVAVLGVILVFLILLLVLLPKKQKPRTETVSPTVQSTQVTKSALQTRLDELKNDLQDADPAAQGDLALPPVNLSLSLDDITK